MEQILWCMKGIHKSLNSLLTPHTSQAWVLLSRGGSRTTSWRDLTVRQSPRRWPCRGLRRSWSVLSKWCEGSVFGALSFGNGTTLIFSMDPDTETHRHRDRGTEYLVLSPFWDGTTLIFSRHLPPLRTSDTSEMWSWMRSGMWGDKNHWYWEVTKEIFSESLGALQMNLSSVSTR